MGQHLTDRVSQLMMKKNITISGARILIMGFTFKENCPDIRNTKAIDVYNALSNFNMNVDVYDPWASSSEVKDEYGINTIKSIETTYDAIIHVVSHNDFLDLDLGKLKNKNAVIYDVKGTLDKKLIDKRL